MVWTPQPGRRSRPRFRPSRNCSPSALFLAAPLGASGCPAPNTPIRGTPGAGCYFQDGMQRPKTDGSNQLVMDLAGLCRPGPGSHRRQGPCQSAPRWWVRGRFSTSDQRPRSRGGDGGRGPVGCGARPAGPVGAAGGVPAGDGLRRPRPTWHQGVNSVGRVPDKSGPDLARARLIGRGITDSWSARMTAGSAIE